MSNNYASRYVDHKSSLKRVGKAAIHLVCSDNCRHLNIEDRVNIIKLLINKCNANLNLKAKHDGTPLHTAISQGNNKIAMLLIDQACKMKDGKKSREVINCQNQVGQTPLMAAIHLRKPQIVKYLLKTNQCDIYGLNYDANVIVIN